MFDIGLVSVSFRSLSPKEIAELCKSYGLTHIEWGSDVHAPFDDLQKLTEISALMKESGLICSSYGSYFRLGEHDTEELYSYIAAAKALGTDIVRIWCGSKDFEDMSEEERAHLISEAKKSAKIATELGVTLCAECHNKTVTNCLDGSLFLMRETDSPAFQMYWQPNQLRSVEYNLEAANALAPYTKIVHVFNWEGKNKYPLSEGAAAWKEYLSCFDGSQTLLLEFMPDGLPESLPAEAEALKIIRKELL